MSALVIIAVWSGITLILVVLYVRKKKELSSAIRNWEILRSKIESERARLEQENVKLRYLEAKRNEIYKSIKKLKQAWNILKKNYEDYKIKKNKLEKLEHELHLRWKELQEKLSNIEHQIECLIEIQKEIQNERKELEKQRVFLQEEKRKSKIEKEQVSEEVGAEEFDENVRSAYVDAKDHKFNVVSSRNKIHIQVGLDFGTSCTKAVYSQLGKKDFRIIKFSQGLPHYPSYVLPSLATFDASGKLLLGVEVAQYLLTKEWNSGFQRFKMIVAGNADSRFADDLTLQKFEDNRKQHGLDDSFSAEILTAVFLAHAICECKKLLQNMPEYQQYGLDIAFNICMPIDQFENDAVIKQFERIFAVAERVAEKWKKEEPNFDAIQTAHDVWDNPFCPDTQRVFAIPESVASIASYLVSLQKKEGLHAVIDFGSGTTDVQSATFVCYPVNSHNTGTPPLT